MTVVVADGLDQLGWALVGLTLSSSGAFVSQAAASGYVSARSRGHGGDTTAMGAYLSCYSFGAVLPGVCCRWSPRPAATTWT